MLESRSLEGNLASLSVRERRAGAKLLVEKRFVGGEVLLMYSGPHR